MTWVIQGKCVKRISTGVDCAECLCRTPVVMMCVYVIKGGIWLLKAISLLNLDLKRLPPHPQSKTNIKHNNRGAYRHGRCTFMVDFE
jgi:hypothetical protein